MTDKEGLQLAHYSSCHNREIIGETEGKAKRIYQMKFQQTLTEFLLYVQAQ